MLNRYQSSVANTFQFWNMQMQLELLTCSLDFTLTTCLISYYKISPDFLASWKTVILVNIICEWCHIAMEAMEQSVVSCGFLAHIVLGWSLFLTGLNIFLFHLIIGLRFVRRIKNIMKGIFWKITALVLFFIPPILPLLHVGRRQVLWILTRLDLTWPVSILLDRS